MSENFEKNLERNRITENLHIVMWLLKDISWCLELKVLGVAMIVPTLIVAVVLTVRMWTFASERYHNLAIICWITANSFWMCVEFFDHENLKTYALIPFSIGIMFVIYYYASLLRRKELKK